MQKNIKIKARVCKFCKQRVMPFIDPYTVEINSKLERLPAGKRSRIKTKIKAVIRVLAGMAGGFATGLFATRAIAKITHRHITGNADYIVATILAVYLAIRIYKARKE